MEPEKSLLKCRASTDAAKLAGSIHAFCSKGNDVVIRCIGAGALNQATKAVIISSKYFASKGVTPLLKPSFQDFETDKGTVTAIELKIILQK